MNLIGVSLVDLVLGFRFERMLGFGQWNFSNMCTPGVWIPSELEIM